jgi:hypothetical protein
MGKRKKELFYSLADLVIIEKKLEKWIQSEREYLDEFQYFDYLQPDKFHIRGYFSDSKHIPTETVSLNKYRDKKTGKPLTDREKNRIRSSVQKIMDYSLRYNEIQNHKIGIILGEDAVNKKTAKRTDKTRIPDLEIIWNYIRIAIEKFRLPKGNEITTCSPATLSKRLGDYNFNLLLAGEINKIRNKQKFGKKNLTPEHDTILQDIFNRTYIHVKTELVKKDKAKPTGVDINEKIYEDPKTQKGNIIDDRDSVFDDLENDFDES